jgi:hypothetical protein
MRVEEAGSKRGCLDPKYCKGRDSNGKIKPKVNRIRAGSACTDPGACGGSVYFHSQFLALKGPNGQDPWDSWTTSSYPWSFPVGDSWGGQGSTEINPLEFEQWLKAVGDDLQGFPTVGWYDTPLYDAGGDLTGTGCIYGRCYDRSELNYIGEGEALAKLGLSKETTHKVVFTWKNRYSLIYGLAGLDSTTKPVSQGTYEMTDIGWDYYNEHYAGVP